MAINTGVNASKLVGYAALAGPENVSATKLVAYAVLGGPAIEMRLAPTVRDRIGPLHLDFAVPARFDSDARPPSTALGTLAGKTVRDATTKGANRGRYLWKYYALTNLTVLPNAITVPTGHVAIQGSYPRTSTTVTVPTGHIVVEGKTPRTSTVVVVPAGAIEIAGHVPGVVPAPTGPLYPPEVVDVPTGHVVVAGKKPQLVQPAQVVDVPTGRVVVDGFVPDIAKYVGPQVVTVPTGKIVVSGWWPYAMTIPALCDPAQAGLVEPDLGPDYSAW